MRLTLITCFHNSVLRLDRYFEALRKLDIQGVQLDLVLVDNASTDETLRRLEAGARAFEFPAQVLQEFKPGLMHARCAAMLAATGDMVLFLDDDNEPQADYLQELKRLRGRFPQAAFYCGNSLPPPEYGVPEELLKVAGVVAMREERGEFEFDLVSVQHANGPWGAGLCGPRQLLARACKEWQNTDQVIKGRTGNGLSGGEDFWMVNCVCRENRRIVFSDKLVLIHRINPCRLRPEHLVMVIFQGGFDWPIHLGAFRALRPEVLDQCPEPLKLLLVMVPRSLMALFVRRNFGAVMSLSHRFGLGLRLAIQVWQRQKRKRGSQG